MQNNRPHGTPTTFANRIGAAIWGAFTATIIGICLFAISSTFKNNSEYALMRWMTAHLTIHSFLTLLVVFTAMGFVFGTNWIGTLFSVFWGADSSKNASKGKSSWNIGTVMIIIAVIVMLLWYFA